MTLIRENVTCTPDRGTIIPSPLDAVLALRSRLHMRAKRRAIKQLLLAEQHRLDDLGVTRADIREALGGKGDAAAALQCMAAKRRAAQRLTAAR